MSRSLLYQCTQVEVASSRSARVVSGPCRNGEFSRTHSALSGLWAEVAAACGCRTAHPGHATWAYSWISPRVGRGVEGADRAVTRVTLRPVWRVMRGTRVRVPAVRSIGHCRGQPLSWVP
jgi:hypothetical protein